MFLDDKIYLDMENCDITSEEMLKSCSLNAIRACLYNIFSLPEYMKTEYNILNKFRQTNNAYNNAVNRFIKNYGENKCPLIIDGFKNFCKMCNGENGEFDFRSFVKLLNW